MATKLELYNEALDACGGDPLSAITDNTRSRLVLDRQWEPSLTRLLRDLMPNWSKTQAEFDVVSGTPLVRWTNQFAVPEDLVVMLAINGTYPETPSDLWEITRMNNDRILMTDQDTCYAEYIYKPTGSEESGSQLDDYLSEMDPMSHDAFVTLLASRIATRVAQDGRTMARSLFEQYLFVDMPRAKVRTMNEQRMYPERPAKYSLNKAARRTFRNG